MGTNRRTSQEFSWNPITGDEWDADQLQDAFLYFSILEIEELEESDLLLSCDSLPFGTGEFGRSVTNPIPVNGVVGTSNYLHRLRSEKGAIFLFHRLGSFQSSNYPYPIDGYEIVSSDGTVHDQLYFTIYHPRRSLIAPEGMKLLRYDAMPLQTLKLLKKISFLHGCNICLENFPYSLPDLLMKHFENSDVSYSLARRLMKRVINSCLSERINTCFPIESDKYDEVYAEMGNVISVLNLY